MKEIPGCDITHNFSVIREQIINATQNTNCKVNDVNLIAVSKTQGIEKILAAVKAGQRLFGESRVQEALEKWPDIKIKHPDIALHLIGPLQTNKLKQALRIFDVIETLDRPKLAEILAKLENPPECYIQVNIGEEPQKAGIMLSESRGFIRYCLDDLGLPITGLMCIPPANEAPEPYFSLLYKIAEEHKLLNISMGMSDDFETAIQCGATHVRVGSAIFGKRKLY